MKKISIIFVLFFTLLLSACSNKIDSITSSEFKNIMRNNDFYVSSTKSQFSEYDYILESFVAINKQNQYQIEFYVLSDSANAEAFYNYNKNIFEADYISGSTSSKIMLSNYSKYSLLTEDYYKIISRIDDTVIYLNVDSTYKKEVNKILKELKY